MTDVNGFVNGCFHGQHDRVNELNNRIVDRQFPDTPLRPNFDPRPVPTKYALFPIIDRRTPAEIPIESSDYLDDSGFYPTSTNGPPKVVLQNIDTESILRNQTVALQHGAPRGVFVPSSQSDLYQVSIDSRMGEEQPFPNLFTTPHISSSRNPVMNTSIGNSTFHNFTRIQLRNTVQFPN